MLISKVFTISTVLVSSAIAAPVPKERSFDDLQISERSLPSYAMFSHARRIMKDIHKNLKPKPGEAIFWSGQTPHVSGKEDKAVYAKTDAEHFAKTHGKVLLDHALANIGVTIPIVSQNDYSHRLWDFASKRYAQRASGHTHAILGSAVRPESVYNKIEKPALLKNPAVPKLTEHASGKSTVVKGK